MSSPHRVRGVKILKAVSSLVRLQILNFLFDKGPLSYSELMNSLKMDPSRDAGRFAYHLKFLLKSDLIEADVESRKYCLTDLGKMVIDVADRVEKKANKSKAMLVRTSKSALEEFDANKITNSLIKEAKMPSELAQKIAKEAEKQLLKSKTRYLTAPLVREVVNAILIDRGLEEQRHKLTRLGLPVHEVTALLETGNETVRHSASILEVAGDAVFREYTLLSVFPRDIADADLSGALNINGLSSWVLKPYEVTHDLRFFFQKGLDLEKMSTLLPSYPAPKNLESALFIAFNVLLQSEREVSEAQTIDYFNVFLAPFAKGLEPSRIKDSLQVFLSNISVYTPVSLGLELTVPDFLAQKPAFGAAGKQLGKYGEFVNESQLLASLMLEIIAEESASKPVLNPKIIIKVRSGAFADAQARAVLLKAHRFSSERGLLYFANLSVKDNIRSTFSGSGIKLTSDSSGDWEIDTLRAGCLGCVSINLPRLVYESGEDLDKLVEMLHERLEMATRALEIKFRALKQRGRVLLPFLMQETNGDQYIRLENCSWLVSFPGFREALEAFSEKNASTKGKKTDFVEETVQTIHDFTRKISRKRGKHLSPAAMPDSEASQRLAQLDLDRYGVAKVRVSGTREKPYYSTVNRLAFQESGVQSDFVMNGKMHELWAGGGLSVAELGEVDHKPEELLSLTERIIQGGIDYFTYERRMTYCMNCKKSWFGVLSKCPSCGSVGMLRVFDRFSST